MSPAPIRPYLAPFNTIGFEHHEDQNWRSQYPREREPILAIMYDDAGLPTHVLTTRSDYGVTHCADGPVVRDSGAGCIHLDANGNFPIDGWSHRPDRRTRVWLHPHIVGEFSLKGVPLDRQDAANLGWIQLDTPLPQSKPVDYHNDIGNLNIYHPLKDTTSSDCIHYHWCSICKEHYTSEGPCHHTKYNDGDGFTLGCGGEGVDIAQARASVHHLLRLLPPDTVQRIYEQLLGGTFSMENSNDFSIGDRSVIECASSKTRKVTHRPEGRAPYQTSLFHHTLEIDHDALALDESDAEKLYWPGLAWLGSLDHPGRKGGTRTQAPYALTLGWVFEFLRRWWCQTRPARHLRPHPRLGLRVPAQRPQRPPLRLQVSPSPSLLVSSSQSLPPAPMPSWIKIRAALESDPRVHRMAAHIAKSAPGYILTGQAKDLFGSVTDTVTRNALRDVTVMGLSRVWFAANDHTTDGVFRHADLSYLDDLAHIPGFGEAMSSVGYALHDPEAHTVTLPRFVEHNAPDKNGERSKTAAARRQQRLRDKKKAAVEQHQEPPPTTANDSQPPQTMRDGVTSRVTPPVTSRHEENNVTPSLSCSLSISESKSDSDSDPKPQAPSSLPPPPDPDPLGTLKRRINALRPGTWAKSPHWSAEEEAALYEARHNLAALDDQDWHLLAWFFKWANSAQNTGQKDPVKVSARRAHLCHDLAALLDRATTAYKQAGAPRLGDTVTPRVTSRVTPPPEPELPPAENAAAFAGLLAANGIRRHPTVATKPAAA